MSSNDYDDDKSSRSQIRPEAQAYSDAIMNAREIALELKKAILLCSDKRIKLQTVMMQDNNAKIQGMDSGDIEVLEFDIASTYGKARHMHTLARALGRLYKEPMPANPTYDVEYAALYTESVSTRLSAPARR
jgi:hypothetical protein